jgi:hypothetical protein
MADIFFCRCECCDAKLRVPSHRLGTSVPCPRCKNTTVLKEDLASERPGGAQVNDTLMHSNNAPDPDWLDDSSVSPEDAFRAAVRTSLADGVLSSDEKLGLESLRQKLGIPTKVAKQIFDEEKTTTVSQQAAEIKTIDTVRITKLLQLGQKKLQTSETKEALEYFNKALEEDPENSQAWLGRAKALVASGTIGDPSFKEVLVCCGHAVDGAPEAIKEDVLRGGALLCFEYCTTWAKTASRFVREGAVSEAIWIQFLSNVGDALACLDVSYKVLKNIENLKLQANLIAFLIRGVKYHVPGSHSGIRNISEAYEQHLRIHLNHCADLIRQVDSTYTLPSLEKEKLCFVATATMGTPDHPDVVALQYFRDVCLIPNSPGRLFCKFYYRLGPYLANVVLKSNAIRVCLLLLLVKPSAWLLRKSFGLRIDQ